MAPRGRSTAATAIATARGPRGLDRANAPQQEGPMKHPALACLAVLAACHEGPSRQTHHQGLAAAPADAVPVPGDYDGDGCTDMSLKASNGIWYIDLCAGPSTSFHGARLGRLGFGGRWDFAYPGYGDASALPVPADYDGDGVTDLAVKDASGLWGIDHARNHFGTWDEQYQ